MQGNHNLIPTNHFLSNLALNDFSNLSMASLFSSNYHFHPDELSELMSIMTQDHSSGATFSSGSNSSIGTNISPLEDDHDINIFNAINPMNYGSFSDLDHHLVPAEFDVTSPPMGSFHQHQNQHVIGMFDPTSMVSSLDQGIGGGYSNQLLSDTSRLGFGEECYGFGFMSNSIEPISPLSPLAVDNWGIRCAKTPAIFEQTSVKVVKYTEEERRDKILRYLKKRSQRNFNKTIKYVCRKTLADRRIRVRGRFARNNKEQCKEEVVRMKQDETSPRQNESCYCDISQIKMDDDDEEWLQNAVASLLYVPYIAD